MVPVNNTLVYRTSFLAAGSWLCVLILQLLLHFHFKSLHVSIPYLWLLYPMSLFKYFKRMDISALLPDPKGQRIMVVMCIMTTLQHFSNVTLPNILVNMVSSDHRAWVYSYNDSTSDSTSHAITCDDFTRSHNLVIGLFENVIIADITAGQRNWCIAEIGYHRQNPLCGI